MSDFDDAIEKPRTNRRPPIGRPFPKGVSGNPKGRPRKTRALVATKIEGKPGIGYEDKVKELAIKEAYRPIVIREGNRVEKIPIAQAILRKIAVSAANGNVRAQQEFLKLLVGAEADRRMATMELLKAVVDYKEYYNRVLEERERTGTSGPEPFPHPHDLNIDWRTGEVRLDGPASPEQKAASDELHAMRPDIERCLDDIEGRIASDPSNLSLHKKKKKLRGMLDWIDADTVKHNLRSAKSPRRRRCGGG